MLPLAPHRRRLTLALSCCLVSSALAAPAGAAAADRYVSTSGSDANACTATAPCRSFDRAYRSAAPGMSVEVAAGAYGGQSIGTDTTKTSTDDVVFQPATGANVTLGGLSISGKHVEVRNMQTGFFDAPSGGASDITVRNGGGSGIFIGGGSSQVRVIGGSYGGGSDNVAPVKVQGSPAPTDITFDGVIFHDAVRTDSAAHLECIYAADVQRFTVRNSQFRNCAIMDLFITKLSGVNPRDVLIENNFFDVTGSHGGSLSNGYYALMVADHLDNATNFTIRNNSFAQGMSIDAGSVSNFKVEGNVGPLSTCRSGVAFAGNVWTTRTCSSSDRQAMSGFKDVSHYDLHLAPGAAAIDAMTAGVAPASDIDGQSRPSGNAPDAGADEVGGGTTPPPADTTAPDTTITLGSSGSSAETAASFSFTASEAGATFQCRLDAAAWAACSSPEAYSGLSSGSHTFDVRATDTAGNTDATPAARSWTVSTTAPPPTDTTAPSTTITGGPSGSITQTSASLTFTATEAGATFTCRLDGGTWGACASPKAYLALAVGSHTFEVRATDAAGNTDASPATRAWTVTTTPPATGPEVGLIGTRSIESLMGQLPSGTAQAFATSAWRTGTAQALYVYVEPRGSATHFAAGIYADAAGHPGALLAQRAGAVLPGAWNRLALNDQRVTSGTQYWIAIVGVDGTLRFRNRSGAGRSERSLSTTLTALPSTWSAGSIGTAGALSAQASGPAG